MSKIILIEHGFSLGFIKYLKYLEMFFCHRYIISSLSDNLHYFYMPSKNMNVYCGFHFHRLINVYNYRKPFTPASNMEEVSDIMTVTRILLILQLCNNTIISCLVWASKLSSLSALRPWTMVNWVAHITSGDILTASQ